MMFRVVCSLDVVPGQRPCGDRADRDLGALDQYETVLIVVDQIHYAE